MTRSTLVATLASAVLAGACGGAPAGADSPPTAGAPSTAGTPSTVGTASPRAATPADELLAALQRRGVVYWSREGSCAPWKAELDAEDGRWSLVHETIADGLRTTVRYGVGARGDQANLTGPRRRTERHPPSGDGWSKSSGSYCLVTLPIGAITAESATIGEMRWYFDRATCERDDPTAREAACLDRR